MKKPTTPSEMGQKSQKVQREKYGQDYKKEMKRRSILGIQAIKAKRLTKNENSV